MRALPSWNTWHLPRRPVPGESGGGLDRAPGDARRAARAERLDERTLGRGGLATVGAQQVHRAAHRLRALEAEADELAAFDLVADDELGHEADAQTSGDRAFDGLVGV